MFLDIITNYLAYELPSRSDKTVLCSKLDRLVLPTHPLGYQHVDCHVRNVFRLEKMYLLCMHIITVY